MPTWSPTPAVFAPYLPGQRPDPALDRLLRCWLVVGLLAVLLVPAPLRVLLSRFLRRALPNLKVLSHSEIPESKTIRVTSLVGVQ